MPKKTSGASTPSSPPPDKEPAAPQAAPDAPQTLAEADTPERRAAVCPIVGIGASAGGLAAFEAFLSALPADPEPGMAFVLVQHLAPDHKSMLSELVKRHTRMRVLEVTDGMAIQPNCVYIIPPNRDMALLDGTLQLLEPSAPRGQRLPIDFFFRSLAQDQHERAIGIVLSGTGSDGTQGVRAIKGEAGMAMAQSPESTEHDGMPRSAIATGLVDFVLPPAEMPAQLLAYVRHAFGKIARRISPPPATIEDALKKICVLLRAQTGHDFSQYKQTTIIRRVERRLAVHQIAGLDAYIRYLQQTPAEVDALFRDLLIGVTSFFRDPEAYAVLQAQGIPRLFAGKPAGAVIRVWVPGCSTGEEAYSLTILLQEHLAVLRQRFTLQVFATDIDRQAIDQARAGLYPSSIAGDIAPDRLARYFVPEADGSAYRIHKGIRDLLIFSTQDVIQNPPFSRLDLISCRNLLIYMGGDLQKKLLPLFHYALNPGGLLFLGTSESVGEFVDCFATLDSKARLFQRKEEGVGGYRPMLGSSLASRTPGGTAPPATGRAPGEGKLPLRELTEQALLQQYAPVGALVTERGEVLYLHGRTGRFLEPAPGEFDRNILRMAREGLRGELTTALRRAVAAKATVCRPGLRIKTNGNETTITLTVRPVSAGPDATGSSLFLIILDEAPSAGEAPPVEVAAGGAAVGSHEPGPDGDARLAALRQELQAKEENLQSINEELETSNEELQAANEEMQSINEELQSTNEELETSKEELQSMNEELATVNTELHMKVADLSRANSDMANLLAGTGIGSVFVDLQLRIQRFTPAITPLINLIPADVGRPVSHIASNLAGYDRLVADVQAVLDTLVPTEREVQTQAGVWYSLRIRPYRTLDNVIEGAVITFIEITDQKAMQGKLQEAARLALEAQAYAEHVLDTVHEPILVLKADLVVRSANHAYYAFFRTTPEETVGRPLAELGDGQWSQPALRAALDDILPRQTFLRDFAVTVDLPGLGRRALRLNAREVRGGAGAARLILLAMDDVTPPLTGSGGAGMQPEGADE